MEGKEQILPVQSRNGGIVLETAQAISKSTGKNTVKQSNVGKKRNPFSLVRAALLVLRRKKSKSVQAEIVSSKSLLTSLVVSMRPLHLQDHQQEPAPPPPALTIDSFQEPEPGPMWVHGVSSPSSSPFSSASSSTGTMSQYASAQNLQELGRRSNGCNYDEGIDEMEEEFLDDGDEMIDEKATEFIAKFYQQMRLQRDN